MNTHNPLIPHGSFLEQHKSKGKSNLIIAVFTILAIHVVLFTGLLMQGCKRGGKAQENALESAETNLPPINTNVPTPVASNLPPVTAPATSNLPTAAPPVVVSPPVETVPPPAPQEYTVVRGDSFYSIAKAHGVSVSAIAKANPGVNSRHLRVGQKLHLPVAAETGAPGASTNEEAGGGTLLYTVKPGDTLGRIARKHHTTVRAIKEANGLRTDRIMAGQKLKVPPRTPAAPGAPPPTEQPAATSAVPPVTTPAGTNPTPSPGQF